MNALIKIEGALSSLDLTRVIEYSKKIKDLPKTANPMSASLYMRDFLIAIDITNVQLSRITQLDLEAESAVNVAESIAYFDYAPDYLKDKNVKDSSEARKRYIPLDPRVQQAVEIKAKTAAMLSFLKVKLNEFRSAYEAVKKIAYAGDYNNMSQNEGM